MQSRFGGHRSMTIAPEGSEEKSYLEAADKAVSALDGLAAAVKSRNDFFEQKKAQARQSLETAQARAAAAGGDDEKKQLRDAAADAMKFVCEAQVLAGGAGDKLDEWKECRST